jgi:hypothetical protein
MTVRLWEQFAGLIPKAPLRIGTVTVVNAGTVTVTLSNGGTFIARGTATVADVVFIQDGEVRSTVSGLTPFADQDV